MYLVEDVNVVVGEVKLHQTGKPPKRSLSYRVDPTSLQVQVGQVGGVFKSTFTQLPKIISLQIQFHSDLQNR